MEEDQPEHSQWKDAVEENALATEDLKTKPEKVIHAKHGMLTHLKSVPTSTSLKTTRKLDL